MKHIERRIKHIIRNKPGCVANDIAEYLGRNPRTIRRILEDMKQRGLIVGKMPGQPEPT